MDNPKIADNSLLRLSHFLISELHVDLPLSQNNPKRSIRIHLDTLGIIASTNLAKALIEDLFWGSQFWMCEYGSISGEALKRIGLIKTTSDIYVIPYHSEFVDPEWFEYDYEAISCVETCFGEFDVNTYIDYCFRQDFLSNSLYAVNLTRKCAVAIYDRRGIDIATTDVALLRSLREKYAKYISVVSD